jgi:diguanylate cyclase (GGDEF)-like protein
VVVKDIKNFQKKFRSYAVMKRKVKKAFQDNSDVLGECALINIRRIYYLTLIAIPLSILNIAQFAFKPYDTQVLATWRQGIIASHSILLVLLIVFFFIARNLKNRTEPTGTMYAMQYIVAVIIMAFGIIIVSIDQLVTTNITPFLIICIVIGAFFLLRPVISFALFASSYAAFYYLLSFTITNQEVLLSNRVNGATAVGIGFLLSVTLWQYNYTNVIQKKFIEVQQKQLEKMAYYDPLTDLPNRRLFEKLIKREFASMQRYGHEAVLVFLDIDDFKQINDTYGHTVGDEVLRQLADLLKNKIRESDTVARFGGEEFIILLPRTSVEEGYVFAERLRKLIMEKIFTVDSITLQITSSFGVSSLRDVNGKIMDNYYCQADKALYYAKQSGKNRVEKAQMTTPAIDPSKIDPSIIESSSKSQVEQGEQ